MKKLAYTLLASLLFTTSLFAQKSILITNSSDLDRKGEIVEVKTSGLKADFKAKTFILKNENGTEVPYQLITCAKNNTQKLIFQANVKANKSAKYTLTEGKPAVVKAITSARFVPERKDDFAWENDFAAYRMFGPALANENPSNGVDYWAKKTSELVVDSRYKGELQDGLSYHIDRGNGLDFYKVGHALGCGGIAPYAQDSLWVGDNFNSYKVNLTGPLRSVFTLTYDSIKVGNEYYKEEFTVTVDAGSLLNKATVKLTGKAKKMQLATGIFLHDGKGQLKVDQAAGTLAYAEDAVSEFKKPSGRNYVGVVSSNVKTNLNKNAHALLLSDYKVGSTYTYYFGGGWNEWKFPTDQDWFNAVNQFETTLKQPLKVKLK